jgi:hypothetical protein
MIRRIISLALGITLGIAARGQQKNDTVIVSLAKTSKVIFTIQDRSDLEILKHYNFQELFQDILLKVESRGKTEPVDTTTAPVVTTEPEPSPRGETKEEDWTSQRSEEHRSDDDNDKDDDDWQQKVEHRRSRIGGTWQSFNFDLGTNNYLEKGKFPDNNNALYSVRPWGSWYVGASSIQRTRIGKNFFLEWGLGLSWYNFKFQNDATMIVKDDVGLQFVEDSRNVNHEKSKLTANYINASVIPVWDFGGHNRKPRIWDGYNTAFRIGFGPYIAYRLLSRSKLVYTEGDHREKEKVKDSFYLNNFRYGVRLQLGFRGTDLFFNYDINELFASNKGPSLNAFSFGVIF